MRFWSVGAATALILLTSFDSAAGQTFDVKQLEVKQGSLEIGLDNTLHLGVPRDRGTDVNRSAHDQSMDYGLRDWWRLSAVLKLEDPQDVDFRIAKTAVENLFVLKAIDDRHPRDIGFGWFTALEASVHHDTTNSLIFGPIVTLTSGKLSLTANPFFEKTLAETGSRVSRSTTPGTPSTSCATALPSASRASAASRTWAIRRRGPSRSTGSAPRSSPRSP